MNKVLQVHPVLKHFDNAWPIYVLTQQYLKNTVEQSRQAKKRNDKRVSSDESAPGDKEVMTASTASVMVPASGSKSKKKKAHTSVEVVSQDGMGKSISKVTRQHEPTVKVCIQCLLIRCGATILRS
jgi:hypothetical protein